MLSQTFLAVIAILIPMGSSGQQIKDLFAKAVAK
jgi:hypothetical protein